MDDRDTLLSESKAKAALGHCDCPIVPNKYDGNKSWSARVREPAKNLYRGGAADGLTQHGARRRDDDFPITIGTDVGHNCQPRRPAGRSVVPIRGREKEGTLLCSDVASE